MTALFAQALAQHQAGNLAQAEALYEQILARDAGHIDALANLGTLHLQQGNPEKGIGLIERALAINFDQPILHIRRGAALQAMQCLGEAVASYDRALALKADYPELHYSRGQALQELQRLDEAVASYDRALALKPDNFEVFVNRGVALQDLGRLAEAVASYDRAIALNWDFAEVHYNRALTLQDLGRPDEAVASYDNAIALKPDYASAYCNRGVTLQQLGRRAEALASLDRAIALRPDHAVAYNNRGNLLKDLKRLDEALASFDHAIAIEPQFADAHHNRGNVLMELGRCDEALKSYTRTITLNPDAHYLPGSWLYSKMRCCDWEGFDTGFKRIAHAVEAGGKASVPFFFLGLPSLPAQQLQCARTYTEDLFPAGSAPLWNGQRYSHSRIRLGYFSSDLREHPISYLIAEMIDRHDRSRFEVIAISFSNPTSDPVRRRLEKAFDRFIDASTLDDHEVAALARRLEIDIAFDLNGHTLDARTGVFALRCAPVQVSYLGYIGTMGASYIDYIIGDRTVMPDHHKRYYSEKIVYLPHTYQVNDTTRAISARQFSRAELGLPNAAFVFCCFNSSFKITPDLFDIWMRLLHQVDGSVLWLFASNATAVANLRAAAERRGISPDRLVFAPRISPADNLSRYRSADLFLDTFYYNAGATASDALWAGLPVLTCLGGTFAGRMAASLLTAVGMPELITRSHAEYESLAIQLASEPRRLASVRRKLAFNITTEPLFDTALFTRNLEKACMQMHERTQAGLPPNHIVVDV